MLVLMIRITYFLRPLRLFVSMVNVI
eukprot:COSAG05_NODE_9039_length_652_cov_0.922242_2_plen_25_part_01